MHQGYMQTFIMLLFRMQASSWAAVVMWGSRARCGIRVVDSPTACVTEPARSTGFPSSCLNSHTWAKRLCIVYADLEHSMEVSVEPGPNECLAL